MLLLASHLSRSSVKLVGPPRLLQSLISINFGRGVAQICREISLGTEDDTALGLFWKKAEVSKIPDDKIPDDESWMIFFGRYMHTPQIYIYIYIYNIIYIYNYIT